MKDSIWEINMENVFIYLLFCSLGSADYIFYGQGPVKLYKSSTWKQKTVSKYFWFKNFKAF